jgi:hypothetical protein
MPNNRPPAGTYNSQDDNPGGPLASWNGSFQYDDSSNTLTYTRTNPNQQFANIANQSNGNAFNFVLNDGAQNAHFVLPNPRNNGGKAAYGGTCSVNPQDPWTATQN